MKCARCSSEIPGQSRFCLRCGAPVQATATPGPPSVAEPNFQLPLAPARASSSRGLLVATILLSLCLVGALGLIVGGKLLQKPGISDPGKLVQAPGVGAPGALVQAPAISSPGAMVQAPGDSAPQPIVQAPGTSAPDNSDVNDYLEFVRRIELTKQQLIHGELGAALSTYGNLTPNEAEAAASDDAAKSFLPKINQDSSKLADEWNTLTTRFSQRTPPGSCIDLRDKYLDHLAKVQAMFVRVHSALADSQTDTSKALSDLSGMLGTASTEADKSARAADDALADVCKTFRLEKKFDITTDSGGGAASLLH